VRNIMRGRNKNDQHHTSEKLIEAKFGRICANVVHMSER